MQRHKAISSKKQGDRKGGTQVIRKHHAVFPLSPTTKGAFNFLSLQFSNLFTFSNLFGASPREQNDSRIYNISISQLRLRSLNWSNLACANTGKLMHKIGGMNAIDVRDIAAARLSESLPTHEKCRLESGH